MSVSVPLQITLGVLLIIFPVRWILAYCLKFDYFIQPHECSHALCAHNIIRKCFWYCLEKSPSVPMQITLGVLCIILPVRWILPYCWKFGYFIQPHEGSHALCAHNLFSPAWYCLVWAMLKTIASSAILDLWKFLTYRFTVELPCYFSINRKLMKRPFLTISRRTLGSKIWPQTIHFSARAQMLLLATLFGPPHQEIHIVLSLAPQVL